MRVSDVIEGSEDDGEGLRAQGIKTWYKDFINADSREKQHDEFSKQHMMQKCMPE